MGLVQEVRRTFQALVASGNITYVLFPVTGAGAGAYIVLANIAAAWTWSAWTQIVLSVGAADVWLVGISVTDPSAAVAYAVQIGTGAGAAEVGCAQFSGDAILIGAGGGANEVNHDLPYPIAIPAATRVAGRVADGTGASTVSVKIICAVGV